ncbi:ATP-binding cassette domain-containing protein [Methanogenium marinum]|uniref:Molybdate/tungstate import ATP-binding protein WtpC n=1 Tax=Methanogenium marinum TaxID=348610 RepID=A0A9Q4KT20_9EURY|nr:ATP-binding cassette domain-containing protein [Methanogenium marinum]MDE4907673.1 ATP-binding cassette domain-containing protein [Methanogenium marinum]
MTSIHPFETIDRIELSHLTKTYGDVTAVSDVSLDVIGGELLVLIGGSGSGKTTTLRMVNRLIEPDSGIVRINGTDIREFDEVRLRRNIGYVIQQIGLFSHMNVGDNIGLIPKIEGWGKEQIDARVHELLEMVDLPPEIFSARYPRELSGGQQQRVGLARALVMNPSLFLMDEPFGALDPILRKQLQEEFLTIKYDIGRTIIFVTHDIDEAFKLGDRICIMHEGELVQIGTPEELIFHPETDQVAHLVDANRKYRHIETFTVHDLMSPLSKREFYEANMPVSEAMAKILSDETGIAVVMEGNNLRGTTSRQNIVRNRKKNLLLGDITTEPITVTPEDALVPVLQKMKTKNASSALVINREGEVTGMLIPDSVLFHII